MKHRIELTEEQAVSLYHASVCLVSGGTKGMQDWLNANLPTILKTEPLVVTDEMAEEFYHFYLDFNGTSVPSFKATLQAFADRYLTPQPAAEADAAPDVFEAHGLEWYRHDGSDHIPLGANGEVKWLFRGELELGAEYKDWRSNGVDLIWSIIIGWRPADAPAKLRPAPTSEADALRDMHKRAKEAERELELSRKDAQQWKNTAEMHYKELTEARAKVAELEQHHTAEIAGINQRLIECTEGMGAMIAKLRAARKA